MEILKQLEKYGQEHLLKFYSELSEESKKKLEGQLNDIDFTELDKLIKEYVLEEHKYQIPDEIEPASYHKIEPDTVYEKELYEKAKAEGGKLISAGKVGLFTVAGGQGSRLGFDGPKGSYNTTPVMNKTLFQYFAETIRGASKRYRVKLSWYIMTSPINNEDTINFFKENNYFGLDRKCVKFFIQGTMPAVDYNGKIILAEKDSLALAPNGHGGSLLALQKTGMLADMKAKGIEYISYFQVDNPLVSMVNALFIGLHALEKSEMSAIVLRKTNAFEKLGNFCISDNKLLIIEYSDMPDELVTKEDENGELCFSAGSPAIHVISRTFVEKLTQGGNLTLPWHRADKKVSYADDNGSVVVPNENNAVKLESFIFDALPLAEKTMLLEADRTCEFGPVKNKTGVDSAESCRAMLCERDARWLEAAGIKVPRNDDGTLNCKVELPRYKYFDAEDVVDYKEELSTPKPGESVYY